MERVLVSAPGKVILFGEHAVVHQKHAVAASLDLRTYLFLEKTSDTLCTLHLPDVDLEQRQWNLTDLPWSLASTTHGPGHPIQDMHPELEARLAAFLGEVPNWAQRQSLMAFFFLLLTLAPTSYHEKPTGFILAARSFLPVSAGLGSSASYSVALAAALLILFDYIPTDFLTSSDAAAHLEKINSYAYKAEQVIHGNPSGVDNAVAAYGGAKSFLKGQGFETLQGFQSLRLLLTNTKVPRSTNALVAGVGRRKEKYPQVINPIMDAIDAISLRCKEAFLAYHETRLDFDALLTELQELVDINHSLLYALGVSHPSLEKIRHISSNYKLNTKLTGAGGGGCAVTLIPNDADQLLIEAAVEALEKEGYDCYQTSVGGVGVAAVSLGETDSVEWMTKAAVSTLASKFSF
ncbi:mevalonate kinase [Hesseltinella vesiculosa]|uniref:Mevalonate kinase n=1 Tax=Hesseltinella vesiculosa TaxID=101127 RepID=A0A1X2G401_9FUNG|nr:mevalonate kinase [Hesseltinella vesiculosa]